MPLNRDAYNNAAIEAYQKKLGRWYSAISVVEADTKAAVASRGMLTYPAELGNAPLQTPLKVVTYTVVDGVLRENSHDRVNQMQDGFIPLGEVLDIKEEPVIERKLFPRNKRSQETDTEMTKAAGGYMSRFKR